MYELHIFPPLVYNQLDFEFRTKRRHFFDSLHEKERLPQYIDTVRLKEEREKYSEQQRKVGIPIFGAP